MISAKELIVLFDFDGLLVNSEPLHYAAYMQMCKEHAIEIDWDFAKFCHAAHSQAGGFFTALEKQVPGIFSGRLSAASLYADKKRIYEELLVAKPVELMPGVSEVLAKLKDLDVRHAVVTNSPKGQIDVVRKKQPQLDEIPLWVTREDYKQPKPAPDGYLLAMGKLGRDKELVIGFEDTLKGIRSLIAAGAEAVLVSASDYRGIEPCRELGARCENILSWEIIEDLTQK